MSDYIPPELIAEILVRLPVESLIRFTTVCKSWRSLITSPRFTAAHISFSENSENPSKTLLLRRFQKQTKLESYSLLELTRSEPRSVLSRTGLNFPFKCRVGYFRIVGSLHGLVCLSGDLFWNPSTPIILWNPIVRNHVMLPEALCKPEKPHYSVLGFGSASDDYKVVRLVYCRRNDGFSLSVLSAVEIYSLNSGKWRVLGEACHNNSIGLRIPEFVWCQVFLNGFVHWLAIDDDSVGIVRRSILSFDLSNEVFGELTLLSEMMSEKVSDLSISVIRRSLAVIKYDREGESDSCDVWMMKDYHSNESWTKLYRIDLLGVIEKVIGFCDSGEALLALSGNEMALYAPESKQIKSFRIYGTLRSLYVENYVESMLLFGRSRETVEDELESSLTS